jgi:hypothetical protein
MQCSKNSHSITSSAVATRSEAEQEPAGGREASNLQWVRAATFLKCSIAALAPAVLLR